MSSPPQHVVVLGASDKPDRYSRKAVTLLLEHGHHVIPVHPTLERIGDLNVTARLSAIDQPVDTLTLYVNPAASERLSAEIVSLAPRRVIFNPGSESPRLSEALRNAGIHFEEACHLVLLRTGQFDLPPGS